MRALITNDDGIESLGLGVLAHAASAAGFDVVAAAPRWDSSGASASLAAVEEDDRFLVEEVRVDGLEARCFGIEAAPAFITRAALNGAFGPPPDLVLSGINHGLNCGHAILHSGTVGAASTAFAVGTPAVAFSIDTGSEAQWETARQVVGDVLRWVREARPSVLLNVNIPNVPTPELRGLRPARLASFGAVTANVTEVGSGWVAMEYRSAEREAEPGTDVALVGEGYATYTALQPICEAAEAPVTALLGNPTR